MVVCSQCRAEVPRTETVFSHDGDLLCARCGAFDAAHAQVERARAAAHEASSRGGPGGAVGAIVGIAQRAAADRQAGQMHSDLVGLRYTSGVVPAGSNVPCARCQTVVPRTETTLTIEGDPMCRTCAASYDQVAEQRAKEGSLLPGILLGAILPGIGIGIAYAVSQKPAVRKGAVGGTLAVLFLAYFFLRMAARV